MTRVAAGRWLEQVRARPGPLVRLWLWPAGGEDRIWPVLAELGEDDVELRPLDAPVTVEALEADLAELPAGRRLVFAVHRRLPLGTLPVSTVAPADLLLDAEALADLLGADLLGADLLGAELGAAELGDGASPWLEDLVRWSDGWPGPAARLARLASAPEDGGERPAVAEVVASESFRGWFAEHVLERLDPAVLEVLEECAALADDAAEPRLETDLWRERWLDRPEHLAAFEQAVRRWGLVVGPPGGERLPRLLAHELARRARQRPAAVRRARRRARDQAAHALGRGERRRPTSPRPGLELRLLGHPRVSPAGAGDDPSAELAWPLRRALLVVAFLALAPDRRAGRDELVDAVWPDADAGAVSRNFHPTLSHARRVLASGLPAGADDPIPYRQGLYALDPDLDWWIDAVELERLGELAEARAAAGDRAGAVDALERAWALYRGPLLEGFDAEWLAPRREGLRRRHLEHLRRLGELAGELGRHGPALDALRALLLEEPFEEPVHVAVMELYARRGRRDLVRRQFLRLQELLGELRVEPLRETQERYHRLMDHELRA